MTNKLRSALALTIALVITAASAVPVGGYGLERVQPATTSAK